MRLDLNVKRLVVDIEVLVGAVFSKVHFGVCVCALRLFSQHAKAQVEKYVGLYNEDRVATSDWLRVVNPSKAKAKKAAEAKEAAEAKKAAEAKDAKAKRSRRKKVIPEEKEPAGPPERPEPTTDLYVFQHDLLNALFPVEGTALVSGYRLVGCARVCFGALCSHACHVEPMRPFTRTPHSVDANSRPPLRSSPRTAPTTSTSSWSPSSK